MGKEQRGRVIYGPWKACGDAEKSSGAERGDKTFWWEEECFRTALQLRAILRVFGGSAVQYVLEAAYFLCGELGYTEIHRGDMVPVGAFCEMSHFLNALRVGVATDVLEIVPDGPIDLVCLTSTLPAWERCQIVPIGCRPFWKWAAEYDACLLYRLASWVYHDRYCGDICYHKRSTINDLMRCGFPRRWDDVRRRYKRQPVLSLVH
jgi:hypothetical protein